MAVEMSTLDKGPPIHLRCLICDPTRYIGEPAGSDEAIDSRHEMTMCGAYLDRMALGGRRLHDNCRTEDHLYCDHYLKPRCKS